MPMAQNVFGRVRVIPGENGARFPFCHSIYIDGAGVLIDPGAGREALQSLKDGPGIREVWLSHWHMDHIRFLDMLPGVPLSVSESDARFLSGYDAYVKGTGIVLKEEAVLLRRLYTEMLPFLPLQPDRFLSDGDVLRYDGCSVEVIGTPGHTAGHLSFYFREDRVLFMGDYDLSRFGPSYLWADGNIELVRSSIDRLRKIPARVWLTSHGDGMFEADPGELWDEYAAVIDRRNDEILELVSEARTLDTITDAGLIFGHRLSEEPAWRILERNAVAKHLDYLVDRGEIVYKDGKYEAA
jgi:glyoxylase-like metal-dependent hydrolase (beta-lactamase superfamily II)